MPAHQKEVPREKRGKVKGAGYWIWAALLFLAGTQVARLFEEVPMLKGARNNGYEFLMHISQHGPPYPRTTAVLEIGDHDFWSEEFEGREPLRGDRLAEIIGIRPCNSILSQERLLMLKCGYE
jgi:hypothetical protein